MTTDDDGIIAHEDPAWISRANFIIHAPVEKDHYQREQLWAQQIADDRFMICCIPFMVYHLALGDEVVTRMEGEQRYVMWYIAEQSSHHTFRIIFDAATEAPQRQQLVRELQEVGCLVEYFTYDYLAIDADGAIARKTARMLWEKQKQGILMYEDGDAKQVDTWTARGLTLREHILFDESENDPYPAT